MSNETISPVSFENRCHRVLQFARDLYRQSPDWVRFFREVVGVDGAARKVFTKQEEYIAFERSEAFHTIQRMVNALRNNKSTSNSNHEPTRVITVRLPESLHEALKAEANDHATSMNKLCIAKLLQVLEEDEAAQRARAAAARTQAGGQVPGTQAGGTQAGGTPNSNGAVSGGAVSGGAVSGGGLPGTHPASVSSGVANPGSPTPTTRFDSAAVGSPRPHTPSYSNTSSPLSQSPATATPPYRPSNDRF